MQQQAEFGDGQYDLYGAVISFCGAALRRGKERIYA
jgi:hypothetical protein